jgi:hypothetical protein
MTSLEKTARAFHLGSRCSISWAEAIGCPKTARRAEKAVRPRRERGSLAAGRATMTPGRA